ncbi:hypothetical protein M083_1114 [Bacteroides fragilis str. 3986 T(B)9]|uniref:Uncharacterized protein n=3 Tax=Bacteroides fragilis TaxID=817 RepID=A0A015U4I1_BACFG|nr:hypothetical protein M117_0951 [Bacteroides fragilis str. 3774 T13]EXY61423.1 hypothetical protein M111_1032 [Bacteroides fragilis str. 3986T(B)10]EXY66551.1 hypothetical protein M085_0973 [Bacteroides fragilis str. 3986 N(B)19]EXY71331.1 hypothetical protein M083_1114 [Bacteroides fragilis str. 3986 T(B)9]EXY85591.1 hypothetical protein M079_1257 [Bacteroides fragilis str. 3996 N(B) 6]EXY91664.1 hypothetical protein M125_1623 [Bacteroides fragilis str. 3998T(B)3]EXY96609.1 hypothetical pr
MFERRQIKSCPEIFRAAFYLEYHLNRNKDFKVKCIMEWKSGDGFSTL